MDAIQRLRAKAHARNKLVTNKQQKVSVQQQENKEVIVIEQAQPDTVYVPYYDPATVYGEWPYAEYPPYYFGYPSYASEVRPARLDGVQGRRRAESRHADPAATASPVTAASAPTATASQEGS